MLEPVSPVLPAEELRRIRGEEPPHTPPGFTVVSLTAHCSGDSEQVLAKVREVLESLLQPWPWPPLDEWQTRLPSWFVAACVDDRSLQSCVLDQWSLRAWLHWLHPDNRRWYWWTANADDGFSLRIEVLAKDRDFLRGALEWLLRVSGAADLVV